MKLAILGPAIGPGQLGMLMALEANKLHCKGDLDLNILTIGSGPAPEWTDDHFSLSEEDKESCLRKSHLITYETESIPSIFRETFKDKLIPSLQALETFRDRFTEKSFFTKLGFKTAEFLLINSNQSLEEATENFNFPARLKTCQLGYDGHGQILIEPNPSQSSQEDLSNLLKTAWNKLNQEPCLLETQVTIFRELSVICTRSVEGKFVRFPIAENIHNQGVLYRSNKAEFTNPDSANQLYKMTEKIMEELNYVGTFCLEIFQTDADEKEFLINEAAPRVHNSGHFTVEFCGQTNQFDAHIRAICNLEMPQPTLPFKYFSMTNLLGTSQSQYYDLTEELAELFPSKPEAQDQGFLLQTYWYNKDKEKPLRKMGHLSFACNNLDEMQAFEELIDLRLK